LEACIQPFVGNPEWVMLTLAKKELADSITAGFRLVGGFGQLTCGNQSLRFTRIAEKTY
jgi:hypothetical protein